MGFSGRKPLLIAIVSQAVAVLGVLIAVWGYHAVTGQDLALWVKLAVACGSACGTALSFRADWRWAVFVGLLPGLFYGGLALSLPAWLPLAIVLCLAVVFRNVWSDRVPLYLTNVETLEHLRNRIGHLGPVRFIDLGCGTASVPLALAEWNKHPESRFDGVETALVLFLIAKIRAFATGDRRIGIHYRSIWDTELACYDIAYAFLSPHPMARLFEHARSTLPAGALFISNSFDVPDHPPDEAIPLTTGRATKLMLWRMPGMPK